MFYTGAERYYAVEAILESAARGDTVIMTAPMGGGISTVLGQAATRLVDYATVVRVDAEEIHSKNDLLTALLAYFDVNKDDFLNAMKEALAQGPLVVVIDNAHALHVELLTFLAQLQEHFAGAFAVILGGEPALAQAVSEAELWSEAKQVALTALTPAQASEFLANVRGISLAAERLEEEGEAFWPQALMEYSTPHRQYPWRHMAIVLILVLLVLVLWLMARTPKQERVKVKVSPVATQVQEVPPLPDTKVSVEEPDQPQEEKPKPRRKPSPIEERAARDIVFDPEAAKEAQAAAEETSPKEVDEVSTKTQSHEQKRATPKDEENNSERATAKETEKQASKENADAKKPRSTEPDKPKGYRDHTWLLQQPADHWMLQVTLATTEAQAQTICDELGKERSAYYRAIRNDRSAYIVLYGGFSSREEAKAATASLPASYAEKGPFVRQLKQIQAELP